VQGCRSRAMMFVFAFYRYVREWVKLVDLPPSLQCTQPFLVEQFAIGRLGFISFISQILKTQQETESAIVKAFAIVVRQF
jgi:hypothetical protein